MTHAELKGYLQALAKQSGFPDDGLSDFVDGAITFGVKVLWNARFWTFRVQPYTLSISSEAEEYQLADGVVGIRSAREQESLIGNKLAYRTKDEYDFDVPRGTAFASTFPRIYTLSWHDDDKRLYAKFFPTPESGHSILFDAFYNEPKSGVEGIPDLATDALLSCCEQFLYKIGTAERVSARRQTMEAILELERRDKPYGGMPFKILDDTSTYIEAGRPWL
jgi:hypothetical protein